MAFIQPIFMFMGIPFPETYCKICSVNISEDPPVEPWTDADGVFHDTPSDKIYTVLVHFWRYTTAKKDRKFEQEETCQLRNLSESDLSLSAIYLKVKENSNFSDCEDV